MNQSNPQFELYLCEKPSQGRDIANAMGIKQRHDGYYQGRDIFVSWCIGHLLEMLPPDGYDTRYKRWSLNDLPIMPQQWQLAPKTSTKKQLNVIKKLLLRCHSVVIATDADREGETIAREVLDFLHFKGTTRRLWLSALDNISIKRALSTILPSAQTQPLYFSGLARGRADWLIGMNLTRAFTLLANDKQVRSVGRVQTPTLALVVKRDREIAQFKPQPYYEVLAFFETRNSPEQNFLETKWQVPEKLADKQKRCLDKEQAHAVIQRCQQQYGEVITATTQRKKQPPPLLFNLSNLQQEASRRWGYGAQEVLDLAQSLYETHKLISYPRSDCEYLPLSQFNDVPYIFNALSKNDPALSELINQANLKQKSRVWNDKKITAHHAIIPTQAFVGINTLNNKLFNIYNVIRRRYLAQFFPDYEYDQSIIMVQINTDKFKASGRISKIAGWKNVIDVSSGSQNALKSSTIDDLDKELPPVTKGEKLLCDHLDCLEKMTKPPRHYTEGTLIKAMETIGTQVTDKVMKKVLRETAGLGTQATRANIIQTLLQRQYIFKEKKLIKATQLGFELIDSVPETIKDPILTAQWEQQLDDIAQNKGQTIDGFIHQQMQLVKAILNPIQSSKLDVTRHNSTNDLNDLKQATNNHVCPQCGHGLEIRQAIKGSKVGQYYIGCSNFPECRYYTWSGNNIS